MEIGVKNIGNLDGFFLNLFLEVAGQSNAVYEKVNGIRLMDKLRPGIKVHVRCDLWIGFDPKEAEHAEEKKVLWEMLGRLLKEFQLEAELKDVSHK